MTPVVRIHPAGRTRGCKGPALAGAKPSRGGARGWGRVT